MSFINEPIQSILIQPKRQIGPITVNVTIQEETTDALEITKHPVQQGASITDHAFKRPTEFSMRASWRYNTLGIGASLAEIYQKLLTLQSSLVPFDIVTPKRLYKTMLFSALSQTTDKTTENCLMVSMRFEQIIVVPVTTVTVSPSVQKNAASTQATQPAGAKSSFLYQGGQIFGIKPQ